VLALLFAGGLSGWQWSRDEHRRAIAAMPAAERHGQFLRIRHEAEGMCPRRELKTQCGAELDQLLQFPECDEECRSFTTRMRQLWRP